MDSRTAFCMYKMEAWRHLHPRNSAMACESSSSPHQRRRRLLDGQPPSPLPPTESDDGEEEEVETRDWAELPQDALLVVFHRLDIVDIIFGAGHVCRSWRRETRDEPELRRRIDMRRLAKLSTHRHRGQQLCALARTALTRSTGRCEAMWATGISDYYFTSFSRGVRTPLLKSLRLISCNICLISLNNAMKKFPLLEELELSLCSDRLDRLYATCAAAAEACPHLKSLRLNKERYHWKSSVEDKGATKIAKMRRLRSLQLFGNSLGNDGLAAILDGCTQLESLDIRHCFNVRMDRDDMRARCARIRTFRPPNDPTDDYDLPFASPEMWRNDFIIGDIDWEFSAR